eukprot:1144428-Karenia_brevis.AAC.1
MRAKHPRVAITLSGSGAYYGSTWHGQTGEPIPKAFHFEDEDDYHSYGYDRDQGAENEYESPMAGIEID